MNVMSSVLATDIDKGKVLWVGHYPAHYVRQMHLAVEKACPGAMHFIYLAQPLLHGRGYEHGQLPVATTVLEEGYPVSKFLGDLQGLRPTALIVTGYTHPILAATLLWSYWKRARLCFWCDTNLLILLAQNPAIRLIKRSLLKLIFSRAYKLLYIGSRNRDFYQWLMGADTVEEKFYFLPYPAILPFAAKDLSPDCESLNDDGKRKFDVLYLGRLEPVKALDKLIDAIALLPPIIRNQVHLHVYGEGSHEFRLKQLVVDLDIAGLVTFYGSVASNQVSQAYAKADLFVLPSSKEPWGLVVNEAMLEGVPVMCPVWVGAAVDLITDGETGYLLHDNTPERIAAGIERAFHMGEANKRVGMNGRNRVISGGWHVEAASERLIHLLAACRT